MKLKIISDGTPRGTKIIDVATGESLDNVKSIQVYIDPVSPSTAVVEFVDIEFEVIAEVL